MRRLILLIRNLPQVQICLGVILAVMIVVWAGDHGIILCLVIVALLISKLRWTLLSLVMVLSWLTFIYLPNLNTEEMSLIGNRIQTQVLVLDVIQQGSYEQQVILKSEVFSGLSIGKLPAYPKLAAGDYVQGEFMIDKLAENLEYIKSEGINLIFSSNSIKVIEIRTFETIVLQLKSKLISHLQVNLAEDEGSLMIGLLAGGRAASLSKDLKADLKLSGLSHIASISGYNVSVIIGALVAFAGLFPRRRLVLGLIPLLFLFLLFIGVYNLPAQRAVVMAALALVGIYVGRQVHWMWALTFALAVMLILNPLAINSISLWLSLLAFIGVCSFTGVWAYDSPDFISLARETLAATFSVSVVSMPLMIQIFGSVSLAGFITNIFALPLIPPVMALGIVAVGLDMVHDQIGNACFWLANGMLKLVIFIADVGARLEFLHITDMRVAWVCWVGLIMLMVIIDYRKFIHARMG